MPITTDQRQSIIDLLSKGVAKQEIARRLGLSTRQVAAVSAHVTMGSYSAAEKNTLEIVDNSASKHEPLLQPFAVPRGILLGNKVQSAELLRWDPFDSSGAANPHLLIVGQSGSGKTYATQCIVAELARQNVPSVVFDYGQGFERKSLPAAFHQLSDVVEFDVSRDGIAIDPLSILSFDVYGPVNVAQRLADTFQRIYPRIGVQQHALIREVVLSAFKEKAIDSNRRDTWRTAAPPFAAIDAKLRALAEDLENPRRNVAFHTQSHISTAFFFNIFRDDQPKLSWQKIIERSATFVFSLHGLPSSTQKAVTELLLWDLIGYIESRGPHPLQLMVVLDEAHRLSFAAESPVERLLREGRKFGIGVILASQQLADFSDTAFGNTATKLVFRLTEQAQRYSRLFHRGKPGTLSPATATEQVSRLATGTCVAVLENDQCLVRIDAFDNRTGH